MEVAQGRVRKEENSERGERGRTLRAKRIRGKQAYKNLRRAFEDAEKCGGTERGAEQQEERQKDAESPKGWPGTGRSGETAGPGDSPRESAGGEGERAKPGGGGRRASRCRPFDPRRLPLIRSAFGDTGTKAVHHITARPGGSLRSRRLIRGERVGPAEREGGRPRGGGLSSALRPGALGRGRPRA